MLALLAAFTSSATYAVLVSGSNTYKNYRHQADVFQLTKILEQRGIKSANIVLMAYNDIVHHLRNPFKGKVFNMNEEEDVFPEKRTHHFIEGENVTVETFYDVLQGKTGPLKLTKQDNLLLYFCDHGAAGMLLFPYQHGFVFADELRHVFTRMTFKQTLFVIEACFSGSVGEVLDGVPGLGVITAANSVESSYACGWSDRVQAFVTNEFSAHMFDYIENTKESSVMELYEACKAKTKRSHVMLYGDKNVASAKISAFFGKKRPDPKPSAYQRDLGVSVNANAVFPGILQMKMRGKSLDEIQGLETSFANELERRKSVQRRFAMISNAFGERMETTEKVPINNWTCYRNVVRKAERKCGSYDESSMPNIGLFARLCNGHREDDIMQVVSYACEPEKYNKYRRNTVQRETYRPWVFE